MNGLTWLHLRIVEKDSGMVWFRPVFCLLDPFRHLSSNRNPCHDILVSVVAEVCQC